MNQPESEMRSRIATLMESIKDDQTRSYELFHYVWTMICVRRGLMRVVREVTSHDGTRLLLEEVKTGQHRMVVRPGGLDTEVEGLAVQALARILGEINVPGDHQSTNGSTPSRYP